MDVFFILRSMIHIVFVMPAGASLVIQTIVATSAMSGRRNVAGVSLTTRRSYRYNVRGKGRGRRSLCLSFSGFSPSIPVLLGQLSSADSGVITTSASLAAVCAVTFVVAGPAVTAAPVTSTPELLVAELPQKRHQVMDPKEQEPLLANFEDWWASGRSAPQLDLSFASQSPLVTPPVVLVPDPSSALAIPAAMAPSMFSWSVVSSSHSAKQHRSWYSPRPYPAPVPPAITDPSAGSSQTRHTSGGHLQSRDLSPNPSQSRSQTHLPSRGRQCTWDPSASLSRPRSRSQTRPKAITKHGTRHPAVPGLIHGPVTRPEAIPVPRTRRPAVPGPITHLGAVHYNGTRLRPGPVTCLGEAHVEGTCLPSIPGRGLWLIH